MVRELNVALGPNFPILIASDEECLALMPLCDPIEVQKVARIFRDLPTKFTVRERSVTFSQLREMMPFTCVDGENDGFVVAAHTSISELLIHEPADGWDSVRSTAKQVIRCEQRT
jgi:hypothetical protein